MLLHLLVLAPFVAAILMVMTSKDDPKSSSRLAILMGTIFAAMSVALLVSGNVATDAIEWLHNVLGEILLFRAFIREIGSESFEYVSACPKSQTNRAVLTLGLQPLACPS